MKHERGYRLSYTDPQICSRFIASKHAPTGVGNATCSLRASVYLYSGSVLEGTVAEFDDRRFTRFTRVGEKISSFLYFIQLV